MRWGDIDILYTIKNKKLKQKKYGGLYNCKKNKMQNTEKKVHIVEMLPNA